MVFKKIRRMLKTNVTIGAKFEPTRGTASVGVKLPLKLRSIRYRKRIY